MPELYEHQKVGVNFLVASKSAMLCDEMGCGKSRQALVASMRLFHEKKIDRVLVLAPAAVRISWRQEIEKLDTQGDAFLPCIYDPKHQRVYGTAKNEVEARDTRRVAHGLPVLVLSYALLPQARHVQALESWCEDGKTLLIADESSFLKNRTAKQTRGAARIAAVCAYRWLLTGTPIANSPLDLYGQSLVMSNGSKGPLSSFKSWWQFQARYAVLKQMTMGPNIRFKQVVGYQNIDELTKRFQSYVLRREKKDCLDLPPKSYVVREVALTETTWRIYNELRKEALLCLPDAEERPEPNAAVRLLRLCQLTSGHVGNVPIDNEDAKNNGIYEPLRDVSNEKLSWLVEQILEGELATQQAVVIFSRWRRERERLQQMFAGKIEVCRVFGGQQDKNRSFEIQTFQTSDKRRVMIAQVHAGAYGITLHAASTAVYISNTFSYVDRIQSSDRIHRIGQTKPCLYIDILACGPKGQQTCDHFILKTLQDKKSIADVTCNAWREVLQNG